MDIRPFRQPDLAPLIDLTIETFGPFFEDSFRPLVGEALFVHQHGHWRDDYRAQVAGLHDPEHHKYVAVAEADTSIAGYVAWHVDNERRHGRVEILAVAAAHRRRHLGAALCRHAFADLKDRGVEVVEIGTGGDAFHAPARALYESLGLTPVPVVHYLKHLT